MRTLGGGVEWILSYIKNQDKRRRKGVQEEMRDDGNGRVDFNNYTSCLLCQLEIPNMRNFLEMSEVWEIVRT